MLKTINQRPALADPDKLNTVAELKRELHRANSSLVAYASALEDRDACGLKFVALIHSLLIQHVAGNHHGVAAILETYLDANPKLREGVEEASESQLLRQFGEWSKPAADPQQRKEPLPPYNADGVNPWSTKSVEELRAALDAANRAGMRAIAERNAFERVLADMASEVSKIVFAHMRNDREALSKALSELTEKHVVVRDTTTTTH